MEGIMYLIWHKLLERNFDRNPTKSESEVLDYLEDNFRQIPNYTVVKIARESFTSQATINRTCKLLGCSGFSEVKYHISADVKMMKRSSKSASIINLDIVEKIDIDSSKELVRYIKNNKRRLLLFGLGASYISAQYLGRQLMYLGIPTVIVSERQMLSKFEGYSLLVISSSGSTQRCLQMIKDAKKSHMKILSITKKDSPVMKKSDISFYHEVSVDKQDGLSKEQQLHIILMVNQVVSTLN
ncbi:MurR/RpiR family transcriptional regulator [Dolosigranulum savutiense]|uniref:MurR/RpiR family transcriptional regulator n=1 Tax=Dolosigranulum savutiense TaxID=3110288 RepID=A0AB74TUP0_9LACT